MSNYQNSMNSLCAIDEFGRVVSTQNGKKSDKEVGIFYFLWVGMHGDKIYDINKLLAEHPDDLWDIKGPENSPGWAWHYWGEPLFGYYKCCDPYILRKHVEMLTMAGVDYILCDTTNALIYTDVLYPLMQTLDEYSKAGWNVPKIGCYTNSGSPQTVQTIYDVFYKDKNLFPDIWYKPNGKPVIVARDPAKQIPQELYDFFEIRNAQWPNEGFMDDGFPWMEWVFPQPLHNGVINVSVAQHSKGGFVLCDGNWGRGCDHSGDDHHDSYCLGQNFEQQWDIAIEKDAHEVFVTGWNEWGAQKINLHGETVFIDCFNEEYSRDAEPMKNGYGDAFYLQLIRNIRRFKGQDKTDIKYAPIKIDINGDITQWDTVEAVYNAISAKDFTRNHSSIDPDIIYTTEPAENNLISVKVAHDTQNIYFLLEAEKEITETHKPGWMNILIGVGEPKKQGWEGYSYAVNRRKKGSLDKLNMSGNTITYNETSYSVKGRFMQVCVPRDIIGAFDGCEGIYFKAADSVKEFKNINDYYVTGKVLPLGRLSYFYAL